MANKLFALILGLLLIVPHLNALPLPDDNHSSSEEISKPLMERFKLLILTLAEFGEIFTELSEKAPAVFEGVLKDPTIAEDDSEEMQKYMKQMREYLEKTKKTKEDEDKDEAFDMFDEYTEFVDKFDSEKHKDLSPAAQKMEKSLKANGLDEMEKAVKTHFESFIKKFEEEVEDYFKGLNSKEKTEESTFMDWFDKMKNEKDMEKKVELFDNFIDTDSNESA